jgi:hypothetical protein
MTYELKRNDRPGIIMVLIAIARKRLWKKVYPEAGKSLSTPLLCNCVNHLQNVVNIGTLS